MKTVIILYCFTRDLTSEIVFCIIFAGISERGFLDHYFKSASPCTSYGAASRYSCITVRVMHALFCAVSYHRVLPDVDKPVCPMTRHSGAAQLRVSHHILKSTVLVTLFTSTAHCTRSPGGHEPNDNNLSTSCLTSLTIASSQIDLRLM